MRQQERQHGDDVGVVKQVKSDDMEGGLTDGPDEQTKGDDTVGAVVGTGDDVNVPRLGQEVERLIAVHIVQVAAAGACDSGLRAVVLVEQVDIGASGTSMHYIKAPP